MKNILYKSLLILIVLFLDFTAFAQGFGGPPEDDEDDNLQGDDVAVTINTKLIWLLIVGLAFAYYTIKKRSAIKIAQ